MALLAAIIWFNQNQFLIDKQSPSNLDRNGLLELNEH
jgi:hypothetical protein